MCMRSPWIRITNELGLHHLWKPCNHETILNETSKNPDYSQIFSQG